MNENDILMADDGRAGELIAAELIITKISFIKSHQHWSTTPTHSEAQPNGARTSSSSEFQTVIIMIFMPNISDGNQRETQFVTTDKIRCVLRNHLRVQMHSKLTEKPFAWHTSCYI